MSKIDEAYFQVLNDTLGLREDLPLDDPQALRAAYLETKIEQLHIKCVLLRRTIADLTSQRDRVSNELRKLSGMFPDVEKLTHERNYLRLIVGTHRLPDDTAKEILRLRQWVRTAYSALQKAGPKYVAEFEINLPWLTESKDQPDENGGGRE